MLACSKGGAALGVASLAEADVTKCVESAAVHIEVRRQPAALDALPWAPRHALMAMAAWTADMRRSFPIAHRSTRQRHYLRSQLRPGTGACACGSGFPGPTVRSSPRLTSAATLACCRAPGHPPAPTPTG